MLVSMNSLCILPRICCCDSSSDGCGGGSLVFDTRLGQVAQLLPTPMPRLLLGVLPCVTQPQLCWKDVPMDRVGRGSSADQHHPPGIAVLFPNTSAGSSRFPQLGHRCEL